MTMQQNTPAIPAGNYDGVCTGEVQYGQSSNGVDQVGVEVEISIPRGEGAFEPSRVTSILYFSSNAKPYSLSKLKACGWSGSGDIAPQIKGKPCRIGIKYEPYTNPETDETKQTMKVNIFDGGGGITFQKPMSDSQKSNFLATLSQGASAPTQAGGYPASWDQNGPAKPIQATPQTQPSGRFSLGK